jgi:hypothetical protein
MTSACLPRMGSQQYAIYNRNCYWTTDRSQYCCNCDVNYYSPAGVCMAVPTRAKGSSCVDKTSSNVAFNDRACSEWACQDGLHEHAHEPKKCVRSLCIAQNGEWATANLEEECRSFYDADYYCTDLETVSQGVIMCSAVAAKIKCNNRNHQVVGNTDFFENRACTTPHPLHTCTDWDTLRETCRSGTTCTVCTDPIYQYRDCTQIVDTGCNPACSTGSYPLSTGSAVCTCLPGFYSNFNGVSPCLKCPSGTFSTSNGATTCTPCPAGTFYSSTGATACTPCPVGNFYSTTGATVCTQCPVGTSYASIGATVCTSCLVGTFSASIGATVCTPCPPGTHSTSGGATVCTPCPSGTYAATSSGASVCTLCSVGTFSASIGASTVASCQACPLGQYSGTTGATACIACAIGKFADTTKSTQCTDCSLCPVASYYPKFKSPTCYRTGSQSDLDVKDCQPCDCASTVSDQTYITWAGCNGSYGIDGLDFDKGKRDRFGSHLLLVMLFILYIFNQ